MTNATDATPRGLTPRGLTALGGGLDEVAAPRLRSQDARARAWSRRLPAVARLRFEARSVLGGHRAYVDYLRHKHGALGWLDDDTANVALVDRETDLVIEAFWRSGNTFALAAFRLAQPRRPRVGHHVCYPAQVLAAVDLDVPVLVIARDPRATVASAIQWGPTYPPGQWLRVYSRYYEAVARVARRSGRVMVVDFNEVTSDFGAVIERLNHHFGSHFTPFVHTDENVAVCYRLIESDDQANFGTVAEGRVSRPSEERRAAAERITAELLDDRYDHAFARAQRAYRAVLDASPT